MNSLESKPRVFRVTIANMTREEIISWCLNRRYNCTVFDSVGTWWDEETGEGGREDGITLEMVISKVAEVTFLGNIRELLTDRREICAYVTVDGGEATLLYSYDYAGDPVQLIEGARGV